MKFIQYIDLPGHAGPGGFDHAAVHASAARLYVAHTANDAIDVIDCAEDRYLYSIPNLHGVAGALVSEERGLIFSSNRGEDTVGIIDPHYSDEVAKVKVGVRPNGLAFDPARGLLLAANVGNPEIPDSFTVSIVDVEKPTLIASVPVPGRTRWAIFDRARDSFYVNIADPYEIAVIDAADPARAARSIPVPAKGPHGLDLDPASGRLFCACDAGRVFALAASSGKVLLEAELSGTPDVVFFNAKRKHLYVAVGEPGMIDVFQTDTLKRLETISTEQGAHTIGFDSTRNKVYAFLPGSHRANVYLDD